jgi:hypothetical protein
MSKENPYLLAALLLTGLLLAACGGSSPPSAEPNDKAKTNGELPPQSEPSASGKACLITAAIMAPLEVTDFAEFRRQLAEAKDVGVQAVSVDVWWGAVEKAGDEKFSWEYYDKVFDEIRTAGLKIVPIISFHRCGGGPGDSCEIPLPGWIYHQIEGVSPEDLKYRSETGNTLADTIPPWATKNEAVLAEYKEFMSRFEEHFAPYAADFIEINISLGPTGELRYPAYNRGDGWSGTMDRGNFQAYSDLARRDFREWALKNFGGLAGVNARWDLALTDEAEIGPPDDHSSRKADTFVREQDYIDMRYGQDFIDWYNDSLVEHGRRVLLAAHESFDGPMATIPLGMKVPGVHWQTKACAPRPRIAEITAGLLQTSLDVNKRENAYGYDNLLDMAQEVKATTGREIIVHFTALEMDDDNTCGGENSNAHTLGAWLSDGAADRDLVLKGENALAGGINHDFGWDMIEDSFTGFHYSGFTLLRLNEWNDTAKERYRQFITQFKCEK